MNLPPTPQPSALTVTALLDRAGRLFPTQSLVEVALNGTRRVHPLGDVVRDALCLGRGLRALGLPRGTAVATLLGNHRPHLEAQLGVPAAGLVLHTLSPRHPEEALLAALRRAGDGALLADESTLPLARALCAAAGIAHLVLVPGCEAPEALSWSEVLARGASLPDEPAPDEDAPAALYEAVHRPGQLRACMASHRAVVLHAMACATVDGLGLGRRDVILPAMPLYHANGCGLPVVTALLGAKLVLLALGADAARVRETLAAEGVTFAASVTSVWLELAEALSARPDGPALPAGLRLLAGGNAAPQGLVDALKAHGVSLVHVYGMTETGPLATASHEVCAQGYAVPLMDLRIVDEAGTALAPGSVQTGEVQLRGPWVAGSYLDEGATPDRWTDDGWLRTGDLGHRDAHGALRLTGRLKPMIRCGGDWIDASALERLVCTHPMVSSARVRCVPHPRLVEQPAVEATLVAGACLEADGLRAYLAERWAHGEAPPMVIELGA